ncbi:MAG TPA: GNAT family N-acetyltransferase [Pseudonocardiaceae bacterium]|nr:GNAT family N-acetyltransferase [Pseudonocardiaceae bacterium]
MWTVRQATPADGPAVAGIRLRSWRHAYRDILPAAGLAGMRVDPARSAALAGSPLPARLFVAVGGDDVPVAYCLVSQAREAVDRHPELPTGELCAIYADPDVLGTGAGGALHAAAVDHLAAQGFAHAVLWVFEDNQPARRFYQAHGWAPDGGRDDYEFGGRRVFEIRYARSLAQPSRV